MDLTPEEILALKRAASGLNPTIQILLSIVVTAFGIWIKRKHTKDKEEIIGVTNANAHNSEKRAVNLHEQITTAVTQMKDELRTEFRSVSADITKEIHRCEFRIEKLELNQSKLTDAVGRSIASVNARHAEDMKVLKDMKVIVDKYVTKD